MLTARIELALSGAPVAVKSPDRLPDRMAGGLREVDVSLRSVVGSVEVIVIVECRDRNRTSDVTWIEQVRTKRDAVGASKAVAVASGTFSKKAVNAANAYGIELRTLTQLNRADIRRWSGAVQVFQHRLAYSDIKITVTVAGSEPLDSASAPFDELVRTHAFEARFIRYPDELALLSLLDVVRRMQSSHGAVTAKGPVKITLPPQSCLVVSDNPAMMALIGNPPPDDGSAVERHPLIRFDEGEAFFQVGQVERPLRTVQLDFAVRQEARTLVEGESYRYASSSGVIEVAERAGAFGNAQFSVIEHRRQPDENG
jgi:hypothetical protein